MGFTVNGKELPMKVTNVFDLLKSDTLYVEESCVIIILHPVCTLYTHSLPYMHLYAPVIHVYTSYVHL